MGRFGVGCFPGCVHKPSRLTREIPSGAREREGEREREREKERKREIERKRERETEGERERELGKGVVEQQYTDRLTGVGTESLMEAPRSRAFGTQNVASYVQRNVFAESCFGRLP